MSGVVIGQEVFTENGHRAIYAGEIDGQKFVRLIIECGDPETGPEEWPSDELTPVGRVFVDEPQPARGKLVAEVETRIAAMREEEAGVRRSVLDLRQQERDLNAAMQKHPQIALAVDFLEGRITHVVVDGWAGISVQPLSEALIYSEEGWGRRTEKGLKLLCLFGHEKGKAPRWAINQYYDGSGHYTTVDPYRSEGEAKAEIQRRADAEFELWRRGEKTGDLSRFAKAGAAIPQDYLDHCALRASEAKADKISKLKEQIAQLEALP